MEGFGAVVAEGTVDEKRRFTRALVQRTETDPDTQQMQLLLRARPAAVSLSVFGRRAVQHRLFAEHVTAEYRVRTEGRGRTVDEWDLPAHKAATSACERSEQTGREAAGRDAAGARNHCLDCVLGCAAASVQGAEWIGVQTDASRGHGRLKRFGFQRQRR